jgi:5'-phosphate synthase pdxT subunit
MMMEVGVLALQGDFAAHAALLARLGCGSIEVRHPKELAEIAGLIIPGGESTTLLKFLAEEGMDQAIRKFKESGRPLFGTCAGLVLLARMVTHPGQASLDLIDATVERNAYGRQRESFAAPVTIPAFGGDPFPGIFIRAPRIVEVGPRVTKLGSLDRDCVLAREGNVLVASFHPELTDDLRIHSLFLDMVRTP